MYIYNADKINTVKHYGFNHFGTKPVSSAERVEGMFAHQERYAIASDLSVSVLDANGNIVRRMTLAEHLEMFCAFAETFSINEYTFLAKNSLRLNDIWEDDPIGSGGPGVVEESQLTESQKKQVIALFQPFSDVIYPDNIFQALSKKEIKKIKRGYTNNHIFLAEYRKRKRRSEAIGENFKEAQFQEIVWLDLTFKLIRWAISQNYDSFVYENVNEGDGSDNVVNLMPNQFEKTGRALFFQKDKYLDEMPQLIKQLTASRHFKPVEEVRHALWGQQNPMRYWSD